MSYPAYAYAFAGGVVNALIGITQPSWPHVLIGIVVSAYALTHHARA